MSRAHAGPQLRLVAAIATAALTVGACASPERGAARSESGRRSSAPSASATAIAIAGENMVWMGDHYFSPSRLTVKLGATVTWRMLGTQEHDVWSLDGSFHSPTMGPGSVFTHAFTRAGTFKYICVPHHGDGMYGEVVVVD